MTVLFTASQTDSTCTFQERTTPGTKISFSGNDLLGQCFSDFTVHLNHLGILAKMQILVGGGGEDRDSAFSSSAHRCGCGWSSDRILSSRDQGTE